MGRMVLIAWLPLALGCADSTGKEGDDTDDSDASDTIDDPDDDPDDDDDESDEPDDETDSDADSETDTDEPDSDEPQESDEPLPDTGDSDGVDTDLLDTDADTDPLPDTMAPIDSAAVDTDTDPPPILDPSGLLITEVVDDVGGAVRYVELCNRGQYHAPLDGLELRKYPNGGSVPNGREALPDVILAPGEGYVIVWNAHAADFEAVYGRPADFESSVPTGDGNDPYELGVVNGDAIDVYGVVLEAGSLNLAWYYGDQSALRVRTVSGPSATWDAAEWVITDDASRRSPWTCGGPGGDTATDTFEFADTNNPDTYDTDYVDTDGGRDTSAGPFWSDIQGALTPCVGCHNGGAVQGGLNWSAPADLIGQPSGQSALPLVEPGNHLRSYWWHKMNGSHLIVGGSGDRMPRFFPALAQDQLDLIAEWIDGGAP